MNSPEASRQPVPEHESKIEEVVLLCDADRRKWFTFNQFPKNIRKINSDVNTRRQVFFIFPGFSKIPKILFVFFDYS